MKVYISGPISASVLPLEQTRELFAAAADILKANQHESLNPFDVVPPASCGCAGGTSGPNGQAGHTWGCFVRHDLIEMLGCDAILMLPGWETSHGARLELSVAAACGLRVLMDGDL